MNRFKHLTLAVILTLCLTQKAQAQSITIDLSRECNELAYAFAYLLDRINGLISDYAPDDGSPMPEDTFKEYIYKRNSLEHSANPGGVDGGLRGIVAMMDDEGCDFREIARGLATNRNCYDKTYRNVGSNGGRQTFAQTPIKDIITTLNNLRP